MSANETELINRPLNKDPDRQPVLTRTLGPWLPENRIGRDNLTAAFPEKSPQEIKSCCDRSRTNP